MVDPPLAFAWGDSSKHPRREAEAPTRSRRPRGLPEVVRMAMSVVAGVEPDLSRSFGLPSGRVGAVLKVDLSQRLSIHRTLNPLVWLHLKCRLLRTMSAA